ncbi:MAG TPA: aspartate dehydrogenase [Pseudorhodoplanes sp.]|jgi:aspartate dehydrogenase|nr:aspartate dehydrogenase [Pseudorhodoplanes sp.]
MRRIGLIGDGAMSRAVRGVLARSLPDAEICAILTRGAAGADPDRRYVTAAPDLVARRPDIVLECAGHGAVAQLVPEILRAGICTIVMSVGAFADAALLARVEDCAARGGARLICATGAIGGLDALRSARLEGLTSVTYTGRKPPAAWAGTPAADKWDLSALRADTVIFSGDARSAALGFPKNANVTAAVALSGIGFEKTRVVLIAAPSLKRNVHEIAAAGAFGSLQMKLENEALPDNPRTSALAALNAAYLIRRELRSIES